jgi:hypothetical protein
MIVYYQVILLLDLLALWTTLSYIAGAIARNRDAQIVALHSKSSKESHSP